MVYYLFINSRIRSRAGVLVLGIEGAIPVDASGDLEGSTILPVDGGCCSWVRMFHRFSWLYVGSLVPANRSDETNYRILLFRL